MEFKDWPGCVDNDNNLAEGYVNKIVSNLTRTIPATRDFDQMADPREKAIPESEAMVIVKNEREGCYHILSEPGEHSPSWFISDTSMLNIVEPGDRITWQTGSFLRFASSIFPSISDQLTDKAFAILLLEFAQSGVSLVDDNMFESVFGGIIDQSTIDIKEQHQLYEETIGNKYGENPEEVMSRIPALYRPLASFQLQAEMAKIALKRQEQAEEFRKAETNRANIAEKELSKLTKLKKKLAEREQETITKEKTNKI